MKHRRSEKPGSIAVGVAHARPAAPTAGHAATVVEVRADPRSGELWIGGSAERLEPKVMGVLVALARQPGRVCTKRELLDEVWAGTVVTEDVLWRAVSALRRALGDAPRRPRFIETLPRRGYRLRVPIRIGPLPAAEVPAPHRDALGSGPLRPHGPLRPDGPLVSSDPFRLHDPPISSDAPLPSADSPPTTNRRSVRPQRRRRWLALAVAVALILALFGYFALRSVEEMILIRPATAETLVDASVVCRATCDAPPEPVRSSLL